jgi:CCDC81-like prokaryotic HU domain 1/CCDC81-like prokaryotic HU domain 2/SPOR domain
MKLEKHIANLLYRHQCVVVPSFGAFLSEWQSAEIIENQNSFLPPRKLISFNQLIKTNDGLLASHIAKEENISYEAASVLLNSTAVFWTEKLNHKEVLYLENIGEIIESQDNNWIFKPNLNNNFLTDSFGLASFNSPEIVRNPVYVAPVFEEVIEETPLKPTAFKEEHVVFETPKPVVKPIRKPEPKVVSFNNAIQRRNRILKYVASVAIIGCLSVYGLKTYNDNSFEQNQQIANANAKKLVTKKIQEAGFALPNFTEALILQSEITEIQNNTNEVNTNLTSDNKTISIDLTKPFQVVAGSFQSVRRSNVLATELEKLGYKTQISHPKNGIYRVVLASFITEAEAETYKNEVAKNKTYKDTWVLKPL